MSRPDLDESVTVTDGAITVEKSFAAEEFPVPAIKFVLSSSASEPVDVRLTDEIPAEFPMDAVGFHPDYESDNWTAYKDHRVEYERTLDPGEEVVTVYGIRIDDPDEARSFLGEPSIAEVVSESESVEEIIGGDNNQVVRDALSGESEMPGMTGGAAESDELDLDDADTDEFALDDGGDEASDESEDVDLGGDLAADDDETADDGPSLAEEPGELGLDEEADSLELDDEGEAEESEPLELDDGGDSEDPIALDSEAGADAENDPIALDDDAADLAADDSSPPEPRPLADDTTPAVSARPADADALDHTDDEATAAEVGPEEAGETLEADPDAGEEYVDADAAVADADESEDAEETDTTAAGAAGTAVAAGGIASALADEIRAGEVDDDDLDLLKEELDVGGVPRSVDVRIRRLQSQVDDLDAYSAALSEFLDEEGTGQELIEEFRAEVADVTDTVESLEETVEAASEERAELADDVDTVAGDVEGVQSAVDGVEAALAETDEELADVADDVANVEGRIAETEERVDGLDSRTEETEASVADAHETLSGHTEWLEYLEDSAEETEGRIDEVSGRVESLDEEMGDVRNDIAEVDAAVAAVEEDLDAEVENLQAELDAVHEELEEAEQFRERLSDVFGAN